MTNERAYTPSLVLHVLRNPHGWSAEAITAARLQAADEIERLRDALKRVRRVAAEGTTHTGMIAALGILVDRALNPGNGPLPPDYTYHSHEPRVGLTCFQVTDNEMAWKIASQDEPSERRCDCWERISALIVNGPLEGDGLDPTAQRNGIILAANHIAPFNRPAPQGASRDASSALPEEQKALRVQCICGWQGKVGELTELSGRYLCPECVRPFEPMPTLRTGE